VSKNQFSVHGSLTISVDNNVISLDVEGPCNTEFFQKMAVELRGVRGQIDLNNYAALIVLRGEALATQDAMDYFSQYLTTVSVKAVALNLQFAESPSVTKQICHQAYQKAGTKHQFFNNNESAVEWLRSCLNS